MKFVVLAGVILLGTGLGSAEELTGSERYRAEICAGQYACDEERAGTLGWSREVSGTPRVSQNPEKNAGDATANALTVSDKEALSGLIDVKIAFDITAGDGKALLSRLNVIEQTRQSLIKQGVTAHFVLAFRGPATKLVQTDVERVKPEDRGELAKIADKIREMSVAPGVEVLQCSVAIQQQGTSADKVLSPIKVIGNSWISLAAYQAKGYAYIAP